MKRKPDYSKRRWCRHCGVQIEDRGLSSMMKMSCGCYAKPKLLFAKISAT